MGDLTRLAHENGVLLSGSLVAVAHDQRQTTARYLAQHGHWVHADVIEGSFRGQPGLSLMELQQLEAVANVLDIHLMVDNPIQMINSLPFSPQRLTVQLRNMAEASPVMRAGRSKAGEFWIATEELRTNDFDDLAKLSPDGVLVMLTPPGRAGHSADLGRLSTVTAIDALQLPTGVDGGIDVANLPIAASAGVRYAVSGRAFILELSQEMPHVGSTTT